LTGERPAVGVANIEIAVEQPSRVPLLSVRDLHKNYGERAAVDGISFDIQKGHAFGLLGPNGAGKTTTIRMVCGLLTPDRGEVLIDGTKIGGRSNEARGSVGYVPHEIALYPELTAAENLRFFGRLNDLRGRKLADKIAWSLEFVDLSDRANDKLKEFSSGMQRRLNLAVALLGDPKLLILDEPTVGVDPQSRGAILERLRELRADGVAMLYASHYIDEVERFCDDVVIIDHGNVIARGTPAELVATLGGAQRLQVVVDGDVDAFLRATSAIPDVREATRVNGSVRLIVTDVATAIPRVVETAGSLGVHLAAIDIGTPNLEEVFLQLTGRTMRDTA
jgi:ABC-2 type transport system ATP-binding protein